MSTAFSGELQLFLPLAQSLDTANPQPRKPGNEVTL